jgi:5'-nucleotidase
MRPAQTLRILAWRPLLIGGTVLTVSMTSACGQTAATPTPTAAPPTVAAAAPVPSPARPPLASPAPSPAAVTAAPTPSVSASAADSDQTYEVKAGDTLLSISEEVYGDATKWRKIYDANKDLIGADPDKLKLEMKLKIPPKDS